MRVGSFYIDKKYIINWVVMLGWLLLLSLFDPMISHLLQVIGRFLQQWWLHRYGLGELIFDVIWATLGTAWIWRKDQKAAQQAQGAPSSLFVQVPPTKVHSVREYTPAARKMTRKLKP